MNNQISEKNQNQKMNSMRVRLLQAFFIIILMFIYFHSQIIEFIAPYLPVHDVSAIKKMLTLNNNEREIFIILLNAVSLFCLIGFFKQKNPIWCWPLIIVVLITEAFKYSTRINFLYILSPYLALIVISCVTKKNKNNLQTNNKDTTVIDTGNKGITSNPLWKISKRVVLQLSIFLAFFLIFKYC